MLQKFQHHLENNLPHLKGKKLLLATSGGIDSMVLVHLLHQLNFNITVAHCNFMLREEESNGDENFVRTTCEALKIPFFIQKFDTNQLASDYKLSIQLAARKLRYEWFAELLLDKKLDYVLTGHHLDDEIETFLINLTRGTGLDGLTGIPSQNGTIIRPLLPFSREEIEKYAKDNQITWREDSSNASNKYLRNKLRHDVVPILKDLNPSFMHSFQNTLENLKQTQSLADDASRIVYKKVVQEEENQNIINISELTQLENFEAYLFQWLKPLGFTAWEDIYGLVHAQSGKQVFSNTHVVLKDRDKLIVFPKIEKEEIEEYFLNKNQKNLKFPLNISVSKVDNISNTTNCAIFVNEDKIQFPLILRKKQEGDYFFPSGMNGKKKLSKYFKDEKYSLLDKEKQWLLTSNNEIVWVIGKRADERFLANETTQNIIKIEITE
jgi:tRNA(Ile)-lysidine synthase